MLLWLLLTCQIHYLHFIAQIFLFDFGEIISCECFHMSNITVCNRIRCMKNTMSTRMSFTAIFPMPNNVNGWVQKTLPGTFLSNKLVIELCNMIVSFLEITIVRVVLSPDLSLLSLLCSFNHNISASPKINLFTRDFFAQCESKKQGIKGCQMKLFKIHSIFL